MINHKQYPLVSIGLPTYNRADGYLKYALESALNQTYQNIEIVISDNCSSDNTDELVTSYNDPRIRYYKQKENIGPINNFNYCLKQAAGAYFMQLHDDDLIDPDFIETCIKAANYSSDIGIIRTGTRVIDSDNNILEESINNSTGLSTTDFFRSWFACKTSIYLCSTLYNTAKLKKAGGFRQSLFDDVIAIVQLENFGRVDIKEVKASFRKHADEITHDTEISDWCKDSLVVLDMMCDLVDGKKRDVFRNEGLIFLSKINYGFADKVESPFKRLTSYLEVYRMFHYKFLPPPFRKFFLYINPSHGLQFIKRQFNKILN